MTMFINPDDRRMGNRRQVATRQSIEREILEAARRKRSMSRFAQGGERRAIPRARRPFIGAGARAFGGGHPARQGGLAQFLQNRGVGLPSQAKQYLPDGVMPPEIADPIGAEPLPGDPTHPVPNGQDPLSGPTSPVNLPSNPLAGPTSPTFSGQDPFGGMIPLGGGAWFDPTTGMIYGPHQGF